MDLDVAEGWLWELLGGRISVEPTMQTLLPYRVAYSHRVRIITFIVIPFAF
jgi:hypothetical protein